MSHVSGTSKNVDFVLTSRGLTRRRVERHPRHSPPPHLSIYLESLVLDRLLKTVQEIPDHVTALFLIVLGAGVSLVHAQHDTGQALIAAGLAMWRGKQT